MRYPLIAALLLVTSNALAQPGGDPPPPGGLGPAPVAPPSVASSSPGFMFMDKVHSTSMMSADLGYSIFESAADATAVRLDLHGQMVMPAGIGGYLTLPLLYGSIGDESSVDVGNLELGGLYVMRNPGFNFIGRAGIALPSSRADEGGGAFVGDVAQFLNFYSDLTNLPLVVPELTTVRLSGSIEGRSGQLFYRGDAGIDVFVDSPGDNPDPIAHLNLAVGADLGSISAAVEWINLVSTDDGLSADEAFIHAFGISVRSQQGAISPAIAIGFPIDDTLQQFVDFYVFAGVDVALGGFGM